MMQQKNANPGQRDCQRTPRRKMAVILSTAVHAQTLVHSRSQSSAETGQKPVPATVNRKVVGCLRGVLARKSAPLSKEVQRRSSKLVGKLVGKFSESLQAPEWITSSIPVGATPLKSSQVKSRPILYL